MNVILKCVIVFSIFLIFIDCTQPVDSSTVKYFGNLKYLAYRDSLAEDFNTDLWESIEFEIPKNKNILLDSLMQTGLLNHPRNKSLSMQSNLYLYRVLENQDTICYRVSFSRNEFSLIETYSNCEQGFLTSSNTSYNVFYFFQKFFFETYKINIINKN